MARPAQAAGSQIGECSMVYRVAVVGATGAVGREMLKTLAEREFPVGEAVGLASSSSVSHQLRALEQKGFLRRDPNRPRALEVLLPGEDRRGAAQAAAAASTRRPRLVESGPR